MSVARAEDRAPWRHDPSADPGAKTEGGRHDAALSFPFGIGTKAANRPSLFQCALYLISRPWFLHFTLNHHTPYQPEASARFFDNPDLAMGKDLADASGGYATWGRGGPLALSTCR